MKIARYRKVASRYFSITFLKIMTYSAEIRNKKERFYRLTEKEWVKACKQLNPSEIKVLYYLRNLNPFGTIQL